MSSAVRTIARQTEPRTPRKWTRSWGIAGPWRITGSSRLEALVHEAGIGEFLLEHAVRGARTQLIVRFALVVFVVATVLWVPPAHLDSVCLGLAAGYGGWAVAISLWTMRLRAQALRYAWIPLYGDVVALAGLTVVASRSDVTSWTADLLVAGFVIPPLLAATQLRPWVSVSVAVPTVVVYLATSLLARQANDEPVASVLLRTFILAAAGLGCVLLSRVQLSRVLALGGLANKRRELLAEIAVVEERERRLLAEHLHDGALQYVLAARQEVEDLGDWADREVVGRLDSALRATSQLLRSTVSDLHPAVLDELGLAAAVQSLATSTAGRGSLTVHVDVEGWPRGYRTEADALLFATARELLANVVKHAGAGQVWVRLAAEAEHLILTITDDGRGLEGVDLGRRLAQGHIGVASSQARLRSRGGQLSLLPGPDAGTVATATIPWRMGETQP